MDDGCPPLTGQHSEACALIVLDHDAASGMIRCHSHPAESGAVNRERAITQRREPDNTVPVWAASYVCQPLACYPCLNLIYCGAFMHE